MSVAPDWLVDLGHTRAKWGRGAAGELLVNSTDACGYDALERFEQALAGQPFGRVWLSAQSNPERVEQVLTRIQRQGLSCAPLRTGDVPLPVAPAYPALGSDRWLALQWPWLQTGGACCVVGCGTALTVDVVDAEGRHRGGWILAGLASLRAGLLSRARGLPSPPAQLIDAEQPATDSALAIAAGTQLQIVAPVERLIRATEDLLGSEPALWLSGGDAALLQPQLTRPAHRDDHLVLRGLALLGAQR